MLQVVNLASGRALLTVYLALVCASSSRPFHACAAVLQLEAQLEAKVQFLI